MVSSFTTTGATLYDTPDRLAPIAASVAGACGLVRRASSCCWRPIAILAPLNLGGSEVISGRVPGAGRAGPPQITRIAEPSERLTALCACALSGLYRADAGALGGCC